MSFSQTNKTFFRSAEGCLEWDGSVDFPNISRFFSSKNAVYNVEKVNPHPTGSFRNSWKRWCKNLPETFHLAAKSLKNRPGHTSSCNGFYWFFDYGTFSWYRRNPAPVGKSRIFFSHYAPTSGTPPRQGRRPRVASLLTALKEADLMIWAMKKGPLVV